MRIEKDSMGKMRIPDGALYGASTQRAVVNFPISDMRFSKRFISCLGLVKWAAARANQALGCLDSEKCKVICAAAREVIDGSLYDQFVVDVFQTGSGTSTNMNANEVIANRALEILGKERGTKGILHPNDHVNMSQSSNDVIPTVMHIAAVQGLKQSLLPALEELERALSLKQKEFAEIVKPGRTHLQDATPVTLGQEFGGYGAQTRKAGERIKNSLERLLELAIGGTAVGTGLNADGKFAGLVIKEINKETGCHFVEAENHFEAQGSRDAFVEMSGQLKVLACSLIKITNDLRWASSGPFCGLGEISLPAVQPGSSIMPGKVNPVICESVIMAAVQVMGNDCSIGIAGQRGNFELNVMLPVMAYNLMQSVDLLSSSCLNLAQRCITGIKADKDKCLDLAEKSLALCTVLAPMIGYDKAAALAKKAYEQGVGIREAALNEGILDQPELDRALDLLEMAGVK